MKVKVSECLDNVPNENVVTTGDQQTDRQSDQLLELLEWLFATKKMIENISLFLLLSAPALPSLSEYLGLTKVLFIKVNPPRDSSYHFHIWRRLQSVEVEGGEAVREGWCDINYPAV